MCTEAPVAAAFATTSWNGAIAPPARKAHLSVCRGGEQAPELQVSGARCVADAETEPEAALVELALHQPDEAVQLIL